MSRSSMVLYCRDASGPFKVSRSSMVLYCRESPFATWLWWGLGMSASDEADAGAHAHFCPDDADPLRVSGCEPGLSNQVPATDPASIGKVAGNMNKTRGGC